MEERSKKRLVSSGQWGIILTIFTAIYVFSFIKWQVSLGLPPNEWNEWGDFFAGLFAPIATLWLVAGYFLQTRELSASIDEWKIANETANQQTQSIADNTNHTKRDVFLSLADFIIKDIHACAARISRCLEGSVWREYTGDSRSEGHKNIELFCSDLARLCDEIISRARVDQEKKEQLRSKFQNPDLRPQVMRYCSFYENLEEQSVQVDSSGKLKLMYDQSSIGTLYKSLKALNEYALNF